MLMLSDRYYKGIDFWVNWVACPLGAIPYKFDKKCRRFYVTRRSHQRVLRIFLLLVFNNLLLVVLMGYFKKIEDFNRFNQAYLGWVICSIWCIFQGMVALQPKLVCLASNAAQQFLDRHAALYKPPSYNPNTCKANKQIDLFCCITRWSSVLLALLQTAHFVMFARQSPFYLTYYIPDQYYTWGFYLWSLWLHFCTFMITSLNIGLSTSIMLGICAHLVRIVSQDIRCNIRHRKQETDNSLRTGVNMRITYRSLELLNMINLEVGSVMLYPMNWLMLKMIVVCLVNLIKYHKQMVPLVKYTVGLWALTGIVLWGLTLEFCGYMFLYSQRALNSWKHHDWGDDRKVMSKFKKSCRPMKVAYHKVFTIKRLTVLKFFRRVAKAVFKAFVAL